MTIRLSIFHTSDEHGFLKNAPAIKGLVDESRRENATLFVSGGDFFEGSVTTKLLGTAPSEEVLHASAYDAITFGNHDTDRGEEVARRWIEQSPCPVLAANLVDRRSGEPVEGVEPYRIFEMDGVKVGLIGLATPETLTIELPKQYGNLDFADPVAATRRCVDELRAQGADVVGVLAHLGLPAEKQLATEVTGLDFVLGGHTHEPTTTPELVNGAVIAHPGAMRTGVGRLDLDIDPSTRRPTAVTFQHIPITGAEPQDEVVASIVRKWDEAVKAESEQPVGELPRPLSHDDREADCIDDLIGEAMLDRSGADVALLNKKFTRTDLPQQVSVGVLMGAMPFDNRLATVRMKVSDVVRAFDDSTQRTDDSRIFARGRFYTSLDDRKTHVLRDGKPLPEDTEITVAATDYLLSGGLGYFAPETVERSTDGGILRDVVGSHLKSRVA